MRFVIHGGIATVLCGALLLWLNWVSWGWWEYAFDITFFGPARWLILNFGVLVGSVSALASHLSKAERIFNLRTGLLVFFLAELVAITSLPFWTSLTPVALQCVGVRYQETPWVAHQNKVYDEFHRGRWLFLENIPIITFIPEHNAEYVALTHEAQQMCFWEGCLDYAPVVLVAMPALALFLLWMPKARDSGQQPSERRA